jgi:hypothetical protein
MIIVLFIPQVSERKSKRGYKRYGFNLLEKGVGIIKDGKLTD